MPGPKRKSPRLNAYDYSTAGAYFVTVCSRERACVFGSIVDDEMKLSSLGRFVQESWTEIPEHFPAATTDVFVVMPNHVHGIVWVSRAGHAPPLPVVIGAFKSAASRRAGRPLWQRSFYERVVRGESELAVLRQHILDNPLKWALDRENPAS
jgi:putative transposase